MKPKAVKYKIPETVDLQTFKAKALAWAKFTDPVVFLDNNEHKNNPHHRYEAILGVGLMTEVSVPLHEIAAFDQLQEFLEEYPKQWKLGYFTYDLKNEVEKLSSGNKDELDFPFLHFFVPAILIIVYPSRTVEIICTEAEFYGETIWEELLHAEPLEAKAPSRPLTLEAKISKDDYLATIQKIRQHIIEGDIYELNFCQEFFARQAQIAPLSLFHRLNQLTRSPFAAYYQHGAHHLLCASPERFLYKSKNCLISQPIKGTIGRGTTAAEDEALRNELYHSEKDRAENVMIVDLVRNDLARSAIPGSVKVDELFGIYAFSQVFQMISTISAELEQPQDWLLALQRAFPMGSMTGAPKIMSMQLIEQYEQSRRGLYSGAVGYITPEDDFDFNVVIRSLLYNAKKEYLSFQVGGAIVYDSDPEKEYEECLLKAKGILQALGLKETRDAWLETPGADNPMEVFPQGCFAEPPPETNPISEGFCQSNLSQAS